MVGTKLPEEKRLRVLELFTEGRSTREIFDITGVKKNTINAWIRKYEGPQSLTFEEREKLKDKVLVMFIEDRTALEIQRVTGVPRRTVFVWTRPYRVQESYSDEERLVYSEIIDDARKKMGFSYAGLGRLLGVTCQEVRNYCNGFCIPKPDKREKLLKLINDSIVFSSWEDLVEEVKTRSREYS